MQNLKPKIYLVVMVMCLFTLLFIKYANGTVYETIIKIGG